MSKKMKVLIVIIIAWFIIFAVDMARARLLLHPIFALPSWGGEYVGYYGLGYFIEFFYPLMGPGNTGAGVSVRIHPYPYIIINIIIVATLFLRIFFRSKKSQSKRTIH